MSDFFLELVNSLAFITPIDSLKVLTTLILPRVFCDSFNPYTTHSSYHMNNV